MLWLYLAVAALALLIYYKFIQPQKYWRERGVKHLRPWPFIGNMKALVLRQTSLAEWIQDMYNAFPNERYFGVFQFLQPTLVIRDPELILEILVKNVDVFPEHARFVPEGMDHIWDHNLLAMKGGKKLYDMRTTLSPVFTSTKIKVLFGLVKECGQQFINYFEAKDGLVVIEMKDVCSKFTNDVIGTTAFGITCDSLKNPNNEFYGMGKKFSDFSGWRMLIFFFSSISPMLMKIFRIRIIQENMSTFFSNVMKEAIKVRTENKTIRPDIIHLLLDARSDRSNKEEDAYVTDSDFEVVESETTRESNPKTEITDDDIVALAFIFFFAGFDTVSTLMSFTSYELAVNPDIQNKLTKEIDDALKTCNGDITYEVLMGMKYLDMVLNESLRKWPPAEVTDRHSVSSFKIDPVLLEENVVHLEKNSVCWIPIYALLRDPQYYPNPNKFDPERFNNRNRMNLNLLTYLPFGVGPRVCIGLQFGLMETKLLFTLLLSKFEIIPVEKTQIPLKLKRGAFNMATEKGIWLGLKPRNN